ncbi:MAG TPA: hypothetical protein VMU12_03390 [Candidatus Paceibacterota bacterium]|nr:hypothetical protein [Candidatus Paceibacterota bacterium]
MNTDLVRAYELLIGTEPPTEMREWQVAKVIMENWNVPVLGESLAKECVFRIVNHVIFPTNELTQEVVGAAEDKATELFSELDGIDPHMDVIAHLERKYHERAEQEREKLKFR